MADSRILDFQVRLKGLIDLPEAGRRLGTNHCAPIRLIDLAWQGIGDRLQKWAIPAVWKSPSPGNATRQNPDPGKPQKAKVSVLMSG